MMDDAEGLCPPHPEEGASACAFGKGKHNVAPVSKDGAATDLGFTRDRHQMCASRVYPTYVFETPRTRLWNLTKPKLAAPHHEAERGNVVQLNLKSWPNLLQMV